MLHWDNDALGETFDRLYRRHRGELLDFVIREGANPQEAEDLVQTTFLYAFRAVLAGNEPRQVRPWLYAIARNLGRRRFRAASARVKIESLADLSEAGQEPDAPAESDILVGLASLPHKQRDVLLLRAIGHDYSQIARRLDMSVGAVQMQLFRARKTLQRHLADKRKGFTPLVLAWRQVAQSVRHRHEPSSALRDDTPPACLFSRRRTPLLHDKADHMLIQG